MAGKISATHPVKVADALGARWGGNFDDYAAGRIPASQIRCVLCQLAPCDCPPFGTPEYFALIDRAHGQQRHGR